MPLRIPELLAREVPIRFGEAGRTWLASLPERARRLAAEWDLALGAPFEPGGMSGLILRTSRQDAVLKLGVVLDFADFGNEAPGLLAWDGRGAVRVLAHSVHDNATLLERCIPGTPLAAEPDLTTVDRVGMAMAQRLWSARPAACARPVSVYTTDQRERIVRLWTKLGQPIERSLVDEAVDVLARLAETAPPSAALHGDLHPANILRSQREDWLAIDPVPMVGDPAWDLARWAIHRQKALEDDQRTWLSHIEHFSPLAGVDAERVRGWAYGSLVCRTLESMNVKDPGAARRLAYARLLRQG